MASSKMMMKMSSSTSRNSDLIRRKSSNSSSSSSSSTNHHHHHHNYNLILNHPHKHPSNPITVDGLLRNEQAPESSLLDAEITLLDAAGAVTAINETETAGGTITRQESVRTSSSNGGEKIVDDVWKEIVACKQEIVADEMMTLEDFLAKAGAVDEEDVKIAPPPLPSDSFFENKNNNNNTNNLGGFGIGVDEMGLGVRGKRRAILEPLDKAAQQRQRRMIKNRESAARSRERKQAYQAELESLALKLEEENETLLKEKAERTRKRYKQLMEKIVPVTEKKSTATPTRRNMLRKVSSMEW